MTKKWLFDRAWTKDFTKARQDFVADLLQSLEQEVTLASALDVGCGLGDFSKFLHDRGLKVMGVDGRTDNAAEAKRRYPEIDFRTANVEELASQIGTFDLVLCFGLLYHLENPFRAIRQLHCLADKVLLVEGMCVPGSKPTMSLFDESTVEDQGLSCVAFYPSESCLIKMMYRAGFPFVYRAKRLPPHDLFAGSVWRKPVRTVLAASKIALTASNLSSAKERFFLPPDTSSLWSPAEWNPWSTGFSRIGHSMQSAWASLRKSASRLTRPLRKSARPQ